jgi:hypothetical protein
MSMVGASVDFYNMSKDAKDHENETNDEDEHGLWRNSMIRHFDDHNDHDFFISLPNNFHEPP